MKVLIVSHYFLPHIGGIENVVYHEAQELVKLDCEVTIVTSKIPSQVYDTSHLKIRQIRIPVFNLFEDYFGIPYPIFSPELISVLIREIKNTDLVHIHGHIYLSSLVASILAKVCHKKIVLTQQNTFIEQDNILLRLIEKLFDKTVGLFTLESADTIIAASQKTKDYVEAIIKNSKKIVILYNGIDTNLFHPIKNKNYQKKQLGFGDKFVCFSIRRITFKNGIDTLLNTALNFLGNKKIIFVLGGTGPDIEAVKKFITVNHLTNIILTGFIKSTDLPLYYRASDLFILPSKKGEGFPLVVLEAFSSGIPVVATKSGGHEEIIKEGQTGFLVDVGDVQGITDKINYLYQNPDKLNKISNNCRNTVIKGFSWQYNTEKLYGLYRTTLKNEVEK